MLDIITWYLIILFLGWISFPILYTLLPSLPGKGYSLAKLFGMLAWGYLFWILGNLGITANNLGGLTFPLLLLIGAGLWSLKKAGRGVIWDWIKEQRSLVISTEIIFLAAFVNLADRLANGPVVLNFYPIFPYRFDRGD